MGDSDEGYLSPEDGKGGGRRAEEELVPRPVWFGLADLPRLQGLQAAAVDRDRMRVCTATAQIIKNGRQKGGVVQLWSLRRGELQMEHAIQGAPDGGNVQPPRAFFYAPGLRCFLCVAGMNHVWACDVVTLFPAGYMVMAADRKLLGSVFHSGRNELAVSTADGVIKVISISSTMVRDEVRVRRIPQCEFKVCRSWKESKWCENLCLLERLDRLFGATDTDIYMWNFVTGQKLCQVDMAHRSKMCSICTFKFKGSNRLATGDQKGIVKVWNVQVDGLPAQAEFVAHKGSKIQSIVFEESVGCMLTYAPEVPCIKSWDYENGVATSEFFCYPRDFLPDRSRKIPEDIKLDRQYVRATQGEDIPQAAITPTALQAVAMGGGKSVLLLNQGTLARVFSMTSDCSVLSQATGKTTCIRTIYPSQAKGASGPTVAVAACLSQEGTIEMINCDDGIVENVIEPGVSRDIHLLKLKGDHVPLNTQRRKKKTGKGRQQRGERIVDSMTATEKRAILAKRIIRKVAKERQAALEKEGIIPRPKPSHAAKKLPEAKMHFIDNVVSFDLVSSIDRIAVKWKDGTIDLINPDNGVCEVSYGGSGTADASQALASFCFIDPPPLTAKKDDSAMGSPASMDVAPHQFASMSAGQEPAEKRATFEADGQEADASRWTGGESEERNLIAGYNNGMVRVWTGWQQAGRQGNVEELLTFKGAEGVPILGMHYASSQRCVVMITGRGSAHAPHVISCWKLEKLVTGEKLCGRTIREEKITAHQSFLATAIGAECLVIGYQDGVVQMYSININHYRDTLGDVNDTTDGKIASMGTFEAHSGPVASVRASHDGSRILTMSSLNEGVIEWDVIKGTRMRSVEFSFQVHHCDYAADDYSILVANKNDIRRVAPADVRAIQLKEEEDAILAAEAAAAEAANQMLSEHERAIMARNALLELQQAMADDFSEISARWGLATWRSISIKAFAEGYYGSTAFLGSLVNDLSVVDKSFQQAMEKELSVKPMYLFSRHKGMLQAKIADLANSQKLISVGQEHWDENKMYSMPGGSTRIMGIINETRARVDEEYRALNAQPPEFVGEEGIDDDDDDEAYANFDASQDRWVMRAATGGPLKSPKSRRGSSTTSPVMRAAGADGDSSMVMSEAGAGAGDNDGDGDGDGEGMKSRSRLLSPTWSLKAPGRSLVGNYKETLEENEDFAEASLKVPPWLRSSLALQPRAKHKTKHVMTEEEEDAMLEEQARRAPLDVHPWVHPLTKLSLSKQGLAAQGIPTDPEEWDTPDAVEMLTRPRVSEFRELSKQRPGSAQAGLAVMEESGERYKFGTSAEVDAILRRTLGQEAGGRSVSVPLVERDGVWKCHEVPERVGGILIAQQKTHAEGRGGSHLPPTMERLGIVPPEAFAPKLVPVGQSGVTHPPQPPTRASPRPSLPPPALPSSLATADSQTKEATIETARSTTPMQTAENQRAGGTPLYPGRILPKAPLPNLNSPDDDADYSRAATVTPSAGMMVGGAGAGAGAGAFEQGSDDSVNELLRSGSIAGGEDVSMILTGLKMHLSKVGRGRTLAAPAGGDAASKNRFVQPMDRSDLLFGGGRVLDVFSVARGLSPCVSSSTTETVPFQAEVRLQGGKGVWERVILKEAGPGGGLTQQMVDRMKPLFGINAMDTRRVRLSASIRKVNPSNKLWVHPDGTPNWELTPTTATGGTVYLIFRDYTNGCGGVTTMAEFEGTMKKGKLKPGGGTLYYSKELCIDVLLVSAFRIMFECKSFDLGSMLVLPEGSVLPCSEMEALNRKTPFAGALGGPSGTSLKALMQPLIPQVLARIESWWENVSLGQVWDVLSFHGFAPSHLRRLVKNMRTLADTFVAMTSVEARVPGHTTTSSTHIFPHGGALLTAMSGMSSTPTPVVNGPRAAADSRGSVEEIDTALAGGATTPRGRESKSGVGAESISSPTVTSGTPTRGQSGRARAMAGNAGADSEDRGGGISRGSSAERREMSRGGTGLSRSSSRNVSRPGSSSTLMQAGERSPPAEDDAVSGWGLEGQVRSPDGPMSEAAS